MMHTGIGRTHPLHIEYIHIGAALAVIQDVLSEAILSHPRLHIARKISIVKALGKVIWIQNDLFTKWYVNDGDEFTDGMDYGEVEKEGWLHGRKVIHDDEASSETSSDETASPGRKGVAAGVCPFTGITASTGDLKALDGGARPNGEAEAEAVNGQ